MNLCETAKEVSQYAAGWLNRQPGVKEESLTDWLLDYFTQQSSDIRYYQFTRHEEGRESGADWDWWILLDSGCFKLRVQAKKVRQNHDHYPDIARSNKTGYQLDLLLDSSASLNFYPLYALYGFAEGVERCSSTPRPEPLHICSAQEVYDMVFASARARITSSALLELSIPMPCLFCCPLVFERPGRGPEDLFGHYFRRPPRPRRGDTDPDGEDDFDRRRGYEENVPEIIGALFEMREVNDNTEGLLRKYQEEFAGANGVSIIRAQNHEG